MLRLRSLPLVALAVVLALTGCQRDQYSPHPLKVGQPVSSPGDKVPLAPDANFVDIAAQAGIHFRWTHPAKTIWTNLETFGAGMAFIDYDNDGWMDIFLAGRPHCALYHNNHDGTFTDVTEKAGIKGSGIWTGVAVGDYDNDGFDDLYVSGYKCSMLLHNNRHGGFTDVTAKAGLAEKQWGSCCGFFDADNDGKLDLIVGHYVVSGPPYPSYCPTPDGMKTGCRPQVYPAQFPRLYHNDGQGHFTDVTGRSGLANAHGKDLALAFADYDNDGKMDFYLANDGTPQDMFHNLGHGRFKNVGAETGASYNMDGIAPAGMGVDFADYDRDGRLDMVVTGWQGDGFSLYHQEKGGDYTFATVSAGIGATRHYLGFGAKFVDFNNDGWPDLMFACGHVYDNIEQAIPGTHFRQPTLLFRNEKGHFVRVENAGLGFSMPIVGRGIAVGDIRNDGSQDLLVEDYDGAPLLLQNRRKSSNHWLGVKLAGTRCNRDGYGARVTVKWPGGQSFADCEASGAYLCSMDRRIHFGLGSVQKIQELEVRWPDGGVQKLSNLPVDRYVDVVEAG